MEIIYLLEILTDITDAASEAMNQVGKTGNKEKIYAHEMVRTDAREQKIDAFYEIKSTNSQKIVQQRLVMMINNQTKEF